MKPQLEPISNMLAQSKGCYTGLAIIKGINYPRGFLFESLNCEFDPAVSRKPEFKEAIFQGGDRLIDKDISVLVSRFYGKLFLGQFPLTGGHIMNRSPVRPI